ncbi:MAG: protein kinase [Chitinivibrionales bacterium]|nr:protein kinase [Chitinivibrionales bacterium]
MAFSLKDYEIIDEIGRGGFGSVLRARQKSLGRIVAIKCLIPQRAQNKHDIIRFRREAEAMATLSNDTIISVFDYAYFGGNYYIVMEYIEGISFDIALERGLRPMECMAVLERVAAALRSAHTENVIHHDIKPANILLGKQGQVKLADFGLATFQQEMTQHSSMVAVIGTLSYMAPEAMVNPADVDSRVDIYSLGCILYEILAGKVPFPGDSLGQVSYKVLNEDPPALATGDCPETLEKLTMECLSKDRDKRPSIEQVHSVLAEYVGSHHRHAQENLASFVKGKEIITGTSPAVPLQSRSFTLTPRSIAFLWVCVALLGLSSLALIVYSAIRHNRGARHLPTLGAFQDTLKPEVSFPQGNTMDSEPSPLTTTSPGTDVGTLMIKGMKKSDTLVINGKVARSFSREGFIGVPLAPGPNKVEIRTRKDRIFSKQIEVMPLQVTSWDLKEERRNHE